MKLFITTMLYLLIALTGTAQRNHSLALGADYLKYSYPHKWNSNAILKKDMYAEQSDILTHTGLWIAYYYKRSFSARFHISAFDQYAKYKNPADAPPYFLYRRYANFLDLVFGYNFIPLVFEKDHTISKKVETWLYVGAGYLLDTRIAYQIAPPLPGYFDFAADGKLYDNTIRPAAHFQIKYNPIRYIMLGIGGTYHYVGKDFKPVSGNISLGLQI